VPARGRPANAAVGVDASRLQDCYRTHSFCGNGRPLSYAL